VTGVALSVSTQSAVCSEASFDVLTSGQPFLLEQYVGIEGCAPKYSLERHLPSEGRTPHEPLPSVSEGLSRW
jgi:hypothetical protein